MLEIKHGLAAGDSTVILHNMGDGKVQLGESIKQYASNAGRAGGRKFQTAKDHS